MNNLEWLEQILNEVISKEHGKYVVRSKKGKKLGTHPTKAAARRQLAAVEINKKRK